jgi:hypothetical protein
LRTENRSRGTSAARPWLHDGALDHEHRHAIMGLGRARDLGEGEAAQIDRSPMAAYSEAVCGRNLTTSARQPISAALSATSANMAVGRLGAANGPAAAPLSGASVGRRRFRCPLGAWRRRAGPAPSRSLGASWSSMATGSRGWSRSWSDSAARRGASSVGGVSNTAGPVSGRCWGSSTTGEDWSGSAVRAGKRGGWLGGVCLRRQGAGVDAKVRGHGGERPVLAVNQMVRQRTQRTDRPAAPSEDGSTR